MTIAVDGVISRLTLFELCESLLRAARRQRQHAAASAHRGAHWRVGGLVTGQADLAIGVSGDTSAHKGIETRLLGEVPFVFAVAPHHPLAAQAEPLSDEEIQRHRAVAVADSAQRLAPATHEPARPGQDVLTVASMHAKIEAQLRCLGCGFLPEPLARPHIRSGVLVVKRVQRGNPQARMAYAWRSDALGQPRKAPQGLALQWWLHQLDSPSTRQALLERHRGATADVD